jgi:hypothetical protein
MRATRERVVFPKGERIMKEKAQKAVDLIIGDLSDRRGLKHEWYQIDPEIQAEIKEEWVGLLLSVFKGNQ